MPLPDIRLQMKALNLFFHFMQIRIVRNAEALDILVFSKAWLGAGALSVSRINSGMVYLEL